MVQCWGTGRSQCSVTALGTGRVQCWVTGTVQGCGAVLRRRAAAQCYGAVRQRDAAVRCWVPALPPSGAPCIQGSCASRHARVHELVPTMCFTAPSDMDGQTADARTHVRMRTLPGVRIACSATTAWMCKPSGAGGAEEMSTCEAIKICGTARLASSFKNWCAGEAGPAKGCSGAGDDCASLCKAGRAGGTMSAKMNGGGARLKWGCVTSKQIADGCSSSGT